MCALCYCKYRPVEVQERLNYAAVDALLNHNQATHSANARPHCQQTAHPENVLVLGRGLGWGVHGGQICELTGEVAHVSLVRNVGFEWRDQLL